MDFHARLRENLHRIPRPFIKYDLAFTCIDLESAQAASPVSILLTCIHSRWYYVKGKMYALTAFLEANRQVSTLNHSKIFKINDFCFVSLEIDETHSKFIQNQWDPI